MKLIASILIAYFSILLIAPMPCAIASFTEEEISCEYSCGDQEACTESSGCSEDGSDSDNSCSTSLCCNIQCCHCYCVNEAEVLFASFPVLNTKHASPQNDKITSSFCGDCWQPPELI
ncbi:MAG: hypothetical protein Q8M29_19115 [Bacteroidota bacterium]|nr:hypothetical protein [Bacteroidota bacterium]